MSQQEVDKELSQMLEKPPRYLASDLCRELTRYLDANQVREVYHAYLFGAEAHDGQKRKSGEPYIYHPIAVARILSSFNMDHKGLIAAILHDVLEDTPIAKETIIQRFGLEVAELVDGVSKLSHLNFKSKVEAQAASFQKMILAMTQDIRIILIKLADRLHNMRTLGVMRPDKQRRIAKETLDIYTPIARRLGMTHIRLELEDLCFKARWPLRYKIIYHRCQQMAKKHEHLIDSTTQLFLKRLQDKGVDCQVEGRQKHLYSLYKKMRAKKISFNDVADKFAFRVIVDNEDQCYRALGVVHHLYPPMPGKFKDYIAIPKVNGYQSLHTILMSPDGSRVEIQIRSREMEHLARSGIAAHWLYKTNEGAGQAQAQASGWLNNLLELQRDAGNSMEFMEQVKVDLFPEDVYVFTPLGEIKTIKKGSTVIDFAYAVHTDIGNHCVSARVDNVFVPLKSRLYSGQTVDIDTQKEASPQPSWLKFVATAKARTQICHYLTHMRERDIVVLGRELLHTELAKYGTTLDDISDQKKTKLFAEYQLKDSQGLFHQIGTGEAPSFIVARQLMGSDLPIASEAEVAADQKPLAIRGTEGMSVSFSRCCRPIPGDDIRSVFSMGKGIVIHRQHCRNLMDNRHKQACVPVVWEHHPKGEFVTDLKVYVVNEPGVLANVATIIAKQECNLESVETQIKETDLSVLHFILAVKSREHVDSIAQALRELPQVMDVVRVNP